MIGEVLKQILDEKQINTNELANRIDVSVQTLYSIIKRNNMKVDLSVLLKICKELDVNIERFYGDYLASPQTTSPTDSEYKEFCKAYNKLNTKGKQKVREYTVDLLANSEYTLPEHSAFVSDERPLRESEYRIAAHGGTNNQEQISPTSEEIS